ncbi:MAG: DNA polymerase IV [Myxococcaceae bacterium]|nr:DNA polymerase IV [Myxococcaceae bacterium]
MDAFYASVEQRDAPALRGRPVIVGGHPTRGVVLAASYEVRPFGVRSAMPMRRAVQLAPHAVVVKPRFHAYEEASEQVHAILERYTPLVEPLSLDEAFLDVTASQGLFGTAEQMARRIREEIRAATGLRASAGVAPVKFAAKIASDLAKPDGLKVVPPEDVAGFLAPLPVSRLWGVGPRTEERLRALGIDTIGSVAAREPGWLETRLGSMGPHLWELSHGVDEREVVPDRAAKSVGAEDTFEEDLVGMEALVPSVHAQASRVGRRLRRAGVRARVVQLKLKFSDFTLVTRRRTLEAATDDGQTLYRAAAELLAQAHGGRPVRLTGVAAQELVDGHGEQLGLFPAPTPRHSRLNAALDAIAERFGSRAVTTADVARAGDGKDSPRRLRQVGWQGERGEE